MRITPAVLGLLLFASLADATTVNVSVSRNKFGYENEMRIHLEINPTEEVGGELNIFRVDGNHLILVHQPFRKPVPGSCYQCRRDVPLSSDFSDDFYFVPPQDGLYRVEANFGGVKDVKEFTVGFAATTTTSSLSETTAMPEATSTVQAETTTLQPTTTEMASTTMIPQTTSVTEVGGNAKETASNKGLTALAVIIAAAIVCLLGRRRLFKCASNE